MLKKKIKCTVCNHSFELIKEMVYEVQTEVAPMGLILSRKNNVYDAVDCPECGCQMVLKDRMPKVITEIGKDAKG